MRTAKILHVVPSLSNDRGGPSRSVIGLAAAQAAAGAAVTLVAGGAAQLRVFDADGVKVVHGRHLATLQQLPDVKLARALYREIEACDIVHVHSVWNSTTSLSAYLARRAGRLYVISPRGMFDSFNVRAKYRRKMLWHFFVDRNNFSGAAGLHFLDEAELENCAPPFRPNGRAVLVWPNGIDFEKIAAGAAFSSKPTDGSNIKLLFLGRLHPIKGLELQLDVVALLRTRGVPVRLSLVGPDDGAMSDLLAHAREKQVADLVEFSGPIYDDSRYALLRDATAVLLTSHYECNSVAAAETFAAGGLLIGTDTCHLDNASRFGAAIVVSRQAEAVADAIMAVASDRQRNETTRQRAQAFAQQKLSWHAAAEATLRFYDRVLRPS
jgi:glycosyltransferase involved in cell wall biosynthesis